MPEYFITSGQFTNESVFADDQRAAAWQFIARVQHYEAPISLGFYLVISDHRIELPLDLKAKGQWIFSVEQLLMGIGASFAPAPISDD